MEFILLVIYISIYIGLFATSFYALSYISGQKKSKPLFKDDELPKVSIIIPVWNEEKSVARTLDTIFSSNYPSKKFEVILVDNNSTDKTMQITRELKRTKYKELRIYNETKQGKGCALNCGINKAKGDIIFSMDADTMVEPSCVREMTRYFKNPEVMSVTPSMLIHKPKGILQRIQQAEYLLGLFLRKAFSSVNAIFITPGAFSAYRKSFFDKYGGYDEANITEDLEMSLRIQYHKFAIENSPKSPVHTIAPNKFKPLLTQRKRWYTGLMKNTWKYKKIVSPEYGDLGMFVIPIAWISIFFSVFIIILMSIKTIIKIQSELIFMNSINFQFANTIQITRYSIERFLFSFFTNEIMVFILFFVAILWIYLKFASKNVGKTKGLHLSIPLYFLLFSLLFSFWWVVSIFYVIFNKKVKWR